MFLDVSSMLCPSSSHRHLLLPPSEQGADEQHPGPSSQRLTCFHSVFISRPKAVLDLL